MRGYPKFLNSKADVEYVMRHFNAEQWLPALRGLVSSCRDWFFVSRLDSEEEGVTDETHKVLDEGEGEAHVWAQYEYRVNPTARIFRLGFTVEEVEALIAAAENGEGD